MKVMVKHLSVLQVNEAGGCRVGVAQVRKTDAMGRLAQEGAIAHVTQGDGREVLALYTPQEALDLGIQLIACASIASDAPPPMFDISAAKAKDPAGSGH